MNEQLHCEFLTFIENGPEWAESLQPGLAHFV